MNRDYLWKAVFRVFICEFVQFYFPDKYEEVNWSRGVEFLNKELQKIQGKSKGKDRVADVLVRLYLKSGDSIWVLLHIEVQGYVDKVFALRMHQMRYRIEDYFGINPVMLVIYTDDNASFHPQYYEVNTWGTKSRTDFLTYKVMDNPPETYINPDSPISIIMEVAYHATKSKKMNDDAIMHLHLPIVKRLLKKGYSKTHIQSLLSFVEGYVKFANSQNIPIFEEKIDDMVKYETTEDILAKIQRDRQRFMRKIYKQLLDEEKAKLKEVEAERKAAQLSAEKANAEAEKATAEAEKANAEAEKATAEAEKATAEAEKATAEAEKATAEAEKATAEAKSKEEEIKKLTTEARIAAQIIEEKLEMAVVFNLNLGIDKNLIAENIGIPIEQVHAIQVKYKNK
jgi:hypothetical protein